ncbi:MAG: hypothetical protein AAB482_00455 [Patescibacteria group bacterium]
MNIAKNLEYNYSTFINRESPFEFFKGLAAYLEYALSEPALKKVFDEQLNERRILIKEIEILEGKIRMELDEAKNTLVNIIQKNKIDIALFNRHQTRSFPDDTNILQELESFEKGDSIGSIFVSDDIEQHLFDIAANLLQAGYKKELQEFILMSDEYAEYRSRINGPDRWVVTDNQHGNFVFSKTWPERWEKSEGFERERMLKLWGYFELLLQFNASYQHAMGRLYFSSTPHGGLESQHWFGGVTEGVKIFSMAREIQQLAENNMDFYSRVNRNFREKKSIESNISRVQLKASAEAVHFYLLTKIENNTTQASENNNIDKKRTLQSIHLITNSLEPKDTIFLVLDEQFQMPVRFEVENNKGSISSIKKLYDIAYFVDAPNRKVIYSKKSADGINNGLFKKSQVKIYLKTNKLVKPTLVMKASNNTLVLKNEIPVLGGLLKNIVPTQHQSLYIDKTR